MALEYKVPKFFCKAKEYIVLKKNHSTFDKIPTWTNWDCAVYSYKVCLLEELNMVKYTFE